VTMPSHEERVNEPACDATGLMVLHLWIDQGGRLRVRTTSTVDVRSRATTTAHDSTRGEVLEQVGEWRSR